MKCALPRLAALLLAALMALGVLPVRAAGRPETVPSISVGMVTQVP